MSVTLIKQFNSIKFVKCSTSNIASDFPNGPNLYKVFMCIINKTSLEVHQHHLQQILNDDLKVDRLTLNKQLVNVLVDALVYYIIQWPGWQRENEYLSGTLQAQDWFLRFQQYLIFKSRFIIKSAPPLPPICVSENKETQTDDFKNCGKDFAPYTLYIGGPPSSLNNIVFEEVDGNILLRRCTARTWKNPTLKELFHWPNVCVTLECLPEISLSRACILHIKRHMGLCSDTDKPTEAEHITHIRKLSSNENTEIALKPYSLEFFTYYAQQLIDVLRLIPGVQEDRINQIELLLQEFLSDIDEANVYEKTMCSNISVQYHIGNFSYMRKRKAFVSNERRKSIHQNEVSFYEVIVPQMDFSLHHFNAVQDLSDTNDVSFVSLNRMKQLLKTKSSTPEIETLKNAMNKCILFTCTMCQKHVFGHNSHTEMIKHLETVHQAEQLVVCHKCCKEYDVNTLAMNRWQHKCI